MTSSNNVHDAPAMQMWDFIDEWLSLSEDSETHGHASNIHDGPDHPEYNAAHEYMLKHPAFKSAHKNLVTKSKALADQHRTGESDHKGVATSHLGTAISDAIKQLKRNSANPGHADHGTFHPKNKNLASKIAGYAFKRAASTMDSATRKESRVPVKGGRGREAPSGSDAGASEMERGGVRRAEKAQAQHAALVKSREKQHKAMQRTARGALKMKTPKFKGQGGEHPLVKKAREKSFKARVAKQVAGTKGLERAALAVQRSKAGQKHFPIVKPSHSQAERMIGGKKPEPQMQRGSERAQGARPRKAAAQEKGLQAKQVSKKVRSAFSDYLHKHHPIKDAKGKISKANQKKHIVLRGLQKSIAKGPGRSWDDHLDHINSRLKRAGHKPYAGKTAMRTLHTTVRRFRERVPPEHSLAKIARSGTQMDHVELIRDFVAGHVSLIECASGLFGLTESALSVHDAAELCYRWLAEQGYEAAPTSSSFADRVMGKVKRPSLFERVMR